MSTDGRHFRSFLVSGWKMRTDLLEHDKVGIQNYLNTGDPTCLPLSYQRLREKIRTNHDNIVKEHLR